MSDDRDQFVQLLADNVKTDTEFAWARNADEKRRAFVFSLMVHDFDTYEDFVNLLDVADRWIQFGKEEAKSEPTKPISHLRPVD